jgi:DNA-binding NtrC family response regulator
MPNTTPSLLRVLLVEDSEDDDILIMRTLRQVGYHVKHERVETAAAMEKALDTKTWDIVISDFAMPHFNGFEALNLIKRKRLDLPFIIVSGAIGEDTAVEAMKSGAHDYIMKDNLARDRKSVV